MGRLSCPFVTVFTTIVFITSVEDKPRTEASRDCANPEPSFEQSVIKEMVGVGSDRTKGEKNVSIGNVVVATIFEEFETRLSRLERRLRAIEQPVWQMSSGEEDWEICAEGPCRCQPEIKLVSCWRQDLLDLPAAQLVPRDVLKLDLAGNRLTTLHRDTFLDMTRLNHLDLSDNSIEHLPLNLFFSLHAVARIRLSKNLLGELHRSQFFNTRNLRILDASSNKLRNLPESLFLSTTLLVLLDLSCNRISSFLPGIFHGLTMLEELLLGKNRLSVLPVDLFKDLTSLKYLGLEENRLRELPDELFRTQTSLRELNFRSNQLSEISARLLAPLEQLNSLEMSNNKIARINPTAFQGLVALKELQLGHNRLRNLTPGLFSMSASLERLVLYANGIENLLRGTFQGLSNLTSLFLHSNHLRIMHPDLFQDTPNLRKLRQLESNYLSSLPPRILDAVESIEQLRLARNPWHCDCAASYLATWLQRMYLTRVNDTNSSENLGIWEFGAGAVCRGPGTLGGRLLLRLTFHELCEGQWASMKGLVPRLPIDLISGRNVASTDNPFSRNESVSTPNLSRSTIPSQR
ncbi:platelet glycoprotein V isoform X1 [Apis mellifera]|uniref:Platelet glycoprotein V isoform X1 n=1 Tax=Apis mellifera TaxID=7460 RepID=A0A7M7M5L8_APIME|nr:platelet glycoprotein V isoform X1 [Apis mellifera]|eukprot:XP_016772077.1 platelet glycoprotein V isoform X1 [Apis mellifera]